MLNSLYFLFLFISPFGLLDSVSLIFKAILVLGTTLCRPKFDSDSASETKSCSMASSPVFHDSSSGPFQTPCCSRAELIAFFVSLCPPFWIAGFSLINFQGHPRPGNDIMVSPTRIKVAMKRICFPFFYYSECIKKNYKRDFCQKSIYKINFGKVSLVLVESLLSLQLRQITQTSDMIIIKSLLCSTSSNIS